MADIQSAKFHTLRDEEDEHDTIIGMRTFITKRKQIPITTRKVECLID